MVKQCKHKCCLPKYRHDCKCRNIFMQQSDKQVYKVTTLYGHNMVYFCFFANKKNKARENSYENTAVIS